MGGWGGALWAAAENARTKGVRPGAEARKEVAKVTKRREDEACIFLTTNPESVNTGFLYFHVQFPMKWAVPLKCICNLFSHLKMYYKNIYDPKLAQRIYSLYLC